jgi:hypothetical protein
MRPGVELVDQQPAGCWMDSGWVGECLGRRCGVVVGLRVIQERRYPVGAGGFREGDLGFRRALAAAREEKGW